MRVCGRAMTVMRSAREPSRSHQQLGATGKPRARSFLGLQRAKCCCAVLIAISASKHREISTLLDATRRAPIANAAARAIPFTVDVGPRFALRLINKSFAPISWQLLRLSLSSREQKLQHLYFAACCKLVGCDNK